jgi:hypothetical protein
MNKSTETETEKQKKEEPMLVVDEVVKKETKKLPATGKVPFFKDGVTILRPVADRDKYESDGWKLVY